MFVSVQICVRKLVDWNPCRLPAILDDIISVLTNVGVVPQIITHLAKVYNYCSDTPLVTQKSTKLSDFFHQDRKFSLGVVFTLEYISSLPSTTV